MIMYNTLMGVSAGLALILVPLLVHKAYKGKPIAPEGWALTFGILGTALTFLSAAMAVTWPLNVNPPINILFSEPSLVFGLLLIAGAILLWSQREAVSGLSSANKATATAAYQRLQRILTPISWLVFALGLVMTACTLAILRFQFVGGAPVEEPISGLLSGHPLVENTFFGFLYALPAVGALLAPFALRKPNGQLWRAVGMLWIAAGLAFLLFSAMNYYTHIGLLTNFQKGTHYRF